LARNSNSRECYVGYRSQAINLHVVVAGRQVPKRNIGVVAYLNNYVYSVLCKWNDYVVKPIFLVVKAASILDLIVNSGSSLKMSYFKRT